MTIISLSESIKSNVLLFLEISIILGSLGVVFLRKIVYSALLLGFVFICIALVYLILNADFLATTQILIYVGAVNVLILFGIMLINKPEYGFSEKRSIGENITLLICIGLFIILSIGIFSTVWETSYSTLFQTDSKLNSNDIKLIGNHILTDMLLPFELLSILLLITLVGCITIAKKESLIVYDNILKLKKD